VKASVSAYRRAARMSASCSETVRWRPARAVVHCARRGQPRQAAPKVTPPLVVIGRVSPAGQVAVRVVWSMVKSSAVNPPVAGARSGIGLMIAVCPASARAARAAPLP